MQTHSWDGPLALEETNCGVEEVFSYATHPTLATKIDSSCPTDPIQKLIIVFCFKESFWGKEAFLIMVAFPKDYPKYSSYLFHPIIV